MRALTYCGVIDEATTVKLWQVVRTGGRARWPQLPNHVPSVDRISLRAEGEKSFEISGDP